MHDGRLKKKNERHCDDMNDDDDTVQINLTRMKFYIKYTTHVHLKLLLFYSFFFPSCACASVALLFFRLSVYAIALHNKATFKTATAPVVSRTV